MCILTAFLKLLTPEVVGSVKPSRTPKPVRRDESNDSLVKQLTQRLGFAFP